MFSIWMIKFIDWGTTMDLKSLNTFIHVAELQSFTRAGEKLGYAQPTISFQVKQLERELGVQLFDRVGHTISLTEEGRHVLEYAQNICRAAEEMARGAEQRQEIRGQIRLTMADSLCTSLVARGFARFRREYPGISLHVTTAGIGEMFRLLDHNEADMICTLDNHIYDTNYIIASEEKIGAHFVCAAKNPLAERENLAVEELLAEPFLLTEKGMSYRRMMDEQLARDSMEIHPVLEMGNADLICRMVAEDMGLSFLPDYVTESDVRAGRLVRLPVEGFEVELWKQLLYHRDKWMSRPMRAVLNHLSGILLCQG